jgi:hypothetical protein
VNHEQNEHKNSKEHHTAIDGEGMEEDEEEEKRRVDKLSDLELAILHKIREINVKHVLEAHPRDVEIIRDKVIAKLCD